jgi:hypothetical protein
MGNSMWLIIINLNNNSSIFRFNGLIFYKLAV